MVTTIRLEEAIGPPPGQLQAATSVHMLAQDAFSTPGATGYAAGPLQVHADGSPTWSMERWLRIAFEPPFTEIRDVYFWLPGLVVTPGWSLALGTTTTYRQPTSSPSTIATQAAPTTKPTEPNAGGRPALTGPDERYSDWIVLQASATGDAPPGPMLGFNPDGSPKPLQYRLDWIEL